ncbi:cellulose synthase family protein [Pontibacter akesuensis]|uniref:Glycosyltransferase, catalytic subunit of cellulose synthase and poly-beta-1,6-N-acetylglucosamine synthase n=1 Tax=Pontibacter akesuensis TaxID=388950 RepID=A0A1I7GS37_9BACT|nr:cellulose synthase family protein [Pontibacter akesuensis]GHA55363.1 glucosyltransferase [Pontibacter akesuensis]SFU51262.1 Glycosyltransferase, catalytic subunit of cellulose synthase and poly-beta-1,6-N-acetylglucosamine synthase [Pontibacter akesuensis]
MMFLITLCVLVYAGAMLFILLYSLAQAHLLYRFRRYLRQDKKPVPPAPEVWPMVTVQLPVYNEKYVVERLLETVAALDYPTEKLEIQVLDDSDDETSALIEQKLQQYPQLSFKYIRRPDRSGYKAGALKYGLELAKGKFIAIFDADFVPAPSFLKETIPYFANRKTGMVQTRWTHLNRDYSILTKLQALALDAHFYVEQVGRNSLHAFINFNGTAGVWRKATILDAGNWQYDTLTEDLDLSYRAQLRGWDFTYLPDVASPAELPPVMSALKSQQFRWTKGGAESAVKHLATVLRSGVPLQAKYHALAHLLNSSVYVAVLLASLASVPLVWAQVNGLLPYVVFEVGKWMLLSFVVISLVYFQANALQTNSLVGRVLSFIVYYPLFLSVSMGLALHNALAVLEGWSGRKSAFIRTPKFNLEARQHPWQKNMYLSLKVPFTTYLEGLLGLLFLGVAAWSIARGEYAFLLLHMMLATGYLLVFYHSFQSYRKA